ncbi:MAG: methionyl-tRNA formyltransferase [Clostridia bacterium]|nr:methionyl-tRNA formyltransferase [Clostridia bacterium]
MKVIFLGAPLFAVNVLKEILNSQHQVVGVVCQPDKKGNRNKMTPCDVKTFALLNDIPVFDWANINEQQNVNTLKELNADVMVTAAYGQMLSQEVLDITKYGVINVHGSLLPHYRGASPIQSAIIDGQQSTGVTIVKSVLKMDAGPILAKVETPIANNDTTDDLFLRLSVMGGKLMVKVLDDLQNDKIEFVPQDEQKVTFCKKIKAEQEKIDWQKDAVKVSCLIRGLSSNPGAYTYLGGKRLKIYNAVIVDNPIDQVKNAGQIVYTKKQMYVFCGDGKVLSLTDLQMAESKRMRTVDFLNGLKVRLDSFDD